MPRTLITFALLVAVALPLIDAALFRPSRKTLGGPRRKARIECLIYATFLFAVLVQALTSFGSMLQGQHESMRGWALIAHMSVAGLFAVTLTAIALLWAEQSTFNRAPDARFYTGEKVAFWLTVVAGFVTLSSALLGMMTWFGTTGQLTLLNLHRWGALALVIVAVFHGYRILLGRPKAKAA
jgi:hypothetical protein